MSDLDPITDMDRRMDRLALDLATNTTATQANADAIVRLEGHISTVATNTLEIIEFFQAAKGAFKFLGWLGVLAKWLGYIGAAFTALYGAIHLAKTGINPSDLTPK
jgi:hypothetical protein